MSDKVVFSSLHTIGMTPIVKLQKLVPPDHADVLVKLEYFNPTGSYKDRMALAMIEEAESRGALLPGKAADVVIFDPQAVSDRPPTGTQPAGPPSGIVHVFTNGTHVVKYGAYVPGSRAGRVLRV